MTGPVATRAAAMPRGGRHCRTLAAIAAELGATDLVAASWTAGMSRSSSSSIAVNGAMAAGRVVFATLGSNDRLEYTVIGDAANLAAKLEKQNMAEGTRAR